MTLLPPRYAVDALPIAPQPERALPGGGPDGGAARLPSQQHVFVGQAKRRSHAHDSDHRLRRVGRYMIDKDGRAARARAVMGHLDHVAAQDPL